MLFQVYTYKILVHNNIFIDNYVSQALILQYIDPWIAFEYIHYIVPGLVSSLQPYKTPQCTTTHIWDRIPTIVRLMTDTPPTALISTSLYMNLNHDLPRTVPVRGTIGKITSCEEDYLGSCAGILPSSDSRCS